jgi:hypothetical protein
MSAMPTRQNRRLWISVMVGLLMIDPSDDKEIYYGETQSTQRTVMIPPLSLNNMTLLT